MGREVQVVRPLWEASRNHFYKELNLDSDQVASLDQYRPDHDAKYEELDRAEGESRDAEIRSRIENEIKNEAVEFDNKTAELLGHEKYEALKSYRDFFNRKLDAETKLRPRVAVSW